MKRLLLLTIIVFIYSCATVPLNERVQKKLGDLSNYSDKELLNLYNRAETEIEIAEKYLQDLDKMKKEETQVKLEGYVPEQLRATEVKREMTLKVLEEWTEARNQIMIEIEKRNLSPKPN